MARTVSLGGHVFPLKAEPPALGDEVGAPGAGIRVLYLAPSLERWPVATAQDFATTVRRFGNADDLLICSADHQPIADTWASRAGWEAVRFDEKMITALGLWIATVSLPARALLIVDASNRLRFCQIAARLEDEVAFDKALLSLRTMS